MITKTTARTLGSVAGFLGAVTGRRLDLPTTATFEQLGDISFGGTEPVPAVDGADVTLVYVGALRSVPAEYTKQHPELVDFPVLTMAVLRADSAGARRAALYQLVPGLLAFREGRLPGSFVRVNDTVARLTVSGRVAAGRYAIAAGEELFEVEVR
jgi:hypothetical protein